MAVRGTNLRILRGLIRELKLTSPQRSAEKTPVYSYILDQFKSHQVTSERVCRGENEMRHLGESYLCLLESVRKAEEITLEYKGKGERSIAESANLVGLRLPKTPDADV